MAISTCKRVNQVLSSGRELSLWERWTFNWHMRICRTCQKIQKQYEILREAVLERANGRAQNRDSDLRSLEDQVLKKFKDSK